MSGRVISNTLSTQGGNDLAGISLERDVYELLRWSWVQKKRPRLIVREGKLSIRVQTDAQNTIVYDLNRIASGEKYVVYDGGSFEGRIKEKYDVKEGRNSPTKESVKVEINYPIDSDSYSVISSDSEAKITEKFLALNALGPSTSETLAKILKIDVTALISKYSQLYDPNDAFIAKDVFPNIRTMATNSVADFSNHYILKDKSYKEMRPWDWSYLEKERELIIGNINNALTRLGYLVTHPLRKKICEKDHQPLLARKRPQTLGGGFLTSKKNPFKRSQTESPNLVDTRFDPSPSKRKFSLISSTSSSSDDEKKNQSTSPPSSVEDDEEIKASRETASSSSSRAISMTIHESPMPSSVFSASARLQPETTQASSTTAFKAAPKRTDYYDNLAVKFRLRYKEYESLYTSLRSHKKSAKKDLVKLYELHNLLFEWKKKLWEFDSRTKSKNNIMNLSKHKKTASLPNADVSPTKISTGNHGATVHSSSKRKPKTLLNY
ncbi:uncharacterized protein PRCAT00000864001 [Priceomyces carsonii]|uniref:uncharacterized protein n=1 Tax=Priceomyces carsonii TaxID=28549 RepID=UPI002ED917B3|nr:unnamed protein product [Priceomyces carsonii]